MAYSDPNGSHNPSTGTSPPAAWGDAVRDDIVWLAGDAASGNPKPMVRAYNSTSQNIATATWTSMTLNSESYDVGGMHSTSSNTSRITVPSGGGGIYIITAHVGFTASSSGAGRLIRILLNGATTLGAQIFCAPSATHDGTIMTSVQYKLAATDYVECQVYQDTGGILACTCVEFAATWQGVG